MTLPGAPQSGDELSGYVTTNISSLLWFLGKSVDSLIFVFQKELSLQGIHEKSQALIEAHQPGREAK